MPTEEGRGGDEKGDPAVTRDDPTRRREEDPVDGPEPEWARRPLQHPELMAENEDLEVLGSVGSTRVSSADEETDEGADDEVEEGQHRPIVPGWPDRESGFSTRTGYRYWPTRRTQSLSSMAKTPMARLAKCTTP
jgi:hypothetical protein